MKINYDKAAGALSILLAKDRISKDEQLAPNVFAGFNRKGELVEIQILDITKEDAPWFTLERSKKRT